MDGTDVDLRVWLSRLLFFGSPGVAVAITCAITFAWVHFTSFYGYSPGWMNIFIYLNAALAFVGSATGELISRHEFLHRIILAPAAGLFGLAAFFLLIFFVDATVPPF